MMKLSAQEIPIEHYDFKIKKFLSHYDMNWKKMTTFGPVRFDVVDDMDTLKKQPLFYQSQYGLNVNNDNFSLNVFGRYIVKNKFYGYHYSRIVNDPYSVERFSGLQRDISRGGLTAGETDLSGIGYNNDWLIMQIGRGRQNWGAGDDIQIVLSEKSQPYDYGMISLNLGGIRARFINGYLESDSIGYNRYITARGIEWSNQKSLVLSLSEIVVYSGLNRPIDIAYFNPFITHLEVELNRKNNDVVLSNERSWNNGNGIWQSSLEYRVNKFFNISLNFIIDEFVLDNIEKKANKEHGLGSSAKISYINDSSVNHKIIQSLSFVAIGTPTFRHGNGNNNFVIRGKPIGWEYGSDTYEIKYSLNYLKSDSILTALNFGFRESGSESIVSMPYEKYEDYTKGIYPSGETESCLFFDGKIELFCKDNYSFNFGFLSKYYNNSNNIFELKLGFDMYLLKTNNNLISDLISAL